MASHEYHSSILPVPGASMLKPSTNKEKQNKDESINILSKMEEL